MIGKFKDVDPKMTISQLRDKMGEADAYLYMAETFKRLPVKKEQSAQELINDC